VNCQARIESARAAVFEAQDGVVTLLMTDLEREWLALARPDPEAGLMDLWARVAPRSWVDRKRWRDSAPAARLDAAIALAADVEGVEAAEAAVDSLRTACAAWGAPIGPRIRWSSAAHDFENIAALLAAPLRAACDLVSARGLEPVVLERAHQLQHAVHEAACVRFPERPVLAGDLAHAAFVDFVWRAASLADRPTPTVALRELWTTGYLLSAVDASGVTLEIPPLSQES